MFFPILFLQIIPTFLPIHDGPNFPFQIRPRSKYDRNESNTNYDLKPNIEVVTITLHSTVRCAE